MGDFFHGLRRKTGCVTLAIALMFMGAWVRSLRSFDEINCPLGNEYAIAMTSWKDALAIRIGWVQSPWTKFYWVESNEDFYGYTDPKSSRYRFEQPIPDGAGDCVTWYLLGYGSGIGFSPLEQQSHYKMLFIIFPYSLIVFGLTVLSACLLLNKPQKSSQKKISDPILAPGA